MGKPLSEKQVNSSQNSQNTTNSREKLLGASKKIAKKKKEVSLDLETNQEEGLGSLKLQQQQKKETSKEIIQRRQNLYDREEDEEIEEEYNIEDAKLAKNSNQDKISDIIVGLLLKNKINSKNAFEVPVVNVLELSDFKNINTDFAWKKLSSTLDAGARIYGYRVDSLHSDTYKIRGGLNRSEVQDIKDANKVNDLEDPLEKDEEIEKKLQKKKFKGGESTLEKNLANINATKYDLEFDIDPLFQKTSAKFDDSGAKGLLMNAIGIDSDVSILLDSSKQQQLWKRRKQKKAIYGEIASLNSGNPTNYESIFKCQLCPEMTNLALDMRNNSKQIFDVSRIRENRRTNFLISTNSEISMQNKLINEIEEGEREIMQEIDAAILNQVDDYLEPLEKEQILLQDNPASFNAANLSNSFNHNLITTNPHGDDDYNDQIIPEQDDIPLEDIYNEKNTLNFDKFNSIEEEHDNTITALIGGGAATLNTSMNSQSIKPLNFLNLEDKLQTIGFGKEYMNGSSIKNWMQPDAWKLPKKQNIKIRIQDLLPELNIFRSKKLKPKGECEIDFDITNEEDFDKVIDPDPINVEKQKSSYSQEIGMLPKDYHISKQLLSSFGFKDPATIFHRSRLGSELDEDDLNNDTIDYYDYNNCDNRIMPVNTHVPSTMSKVLNEIAEKQAIKAKNQMPIKELKTKLWDKLEKKIPMTSGIEHNQNDSLFIQKRVEVEEEEIHFSDVYDQLPDLIGLQNRSRVSLQTCFVTILHLANEKTLRFERTQREGDFKISRDQH
ncbi:hypothetical protein ABPG72_001434 [Tetrahymena utriculariae]